MASNVGAEVRAMPMDIGIEEKDRREIAEGLSRLLADTYTLYLKTHNFHWNVTGPMFQTLHLMFEQQYNELALAVDLIAERIRALGYSAPGSYKEFGKLTSIKEADGVPAAEEMIRQLVEGQETVARTARAVFETAGRRQRRADRRPADRAPASPREDRVDAAEPPRQRGQQQRRARRVSCGDENGRRLSLARVHFNTEGTEDLTEFTEKTIFFSVRSVNPPCPLC